MASNKKVMTFYDGLDRLSNSPKEVIDEILTRMPIRDAVQTSLLSKGWRYRWMSMPDLVFDIHSIIDEDATSRLKFVSKVISLHDGIVSRFMLDRFLECGCADVDDWILILSRKMVKHLALLFQPYSQYQVPGCLFSCRTLTILELKGCVLKLPSDYKGLCCLTELSVYFASLTNEEFEGLVLNNPLLQKLKVCYCKSLIRFNIHAPKLEEIILSGSAESIKLQNALQVRFLVIEIRPPGLPKRVRLDDILQGLDGLESLSLAQPFLELLPMDVEPERLDITYYCLKYVILTVNFEDLKQILAVLCLCRSSPHLQVINIKAIWDRESAHLYEENFWETRLRKEDAILNHLQGVILSGFKGAKNEMGFSQFILLNATDLRTLCIDWEESALMVEKVPVAEKMMQFHKASAIAEVFFKS